MLRIDLIFASVKKKKQFLPNIVCFKLLNSLDSQITVFPAIRFQLIYKSKFKKCTCCTRLFQISSILCWLSLSCFQMESTLVSAMVYVMVNVGGASLLLPYGGNVLEINDFNYDIGNF